MIEEKQKKYIEFARYFSKICRNEQVFNWGLEYFKALQNIDFKLSKHNLDRIKFGKKTYDQDIKKELFNTREEISIDELFLYQLKRSIKKIEFVDEMDKDATAGEVSFKENAIKLKRYKVELTDFEKYFYPSAKIPKYTSSTEFNEHIEDTINKLIFFHELTHILQIKSYQKNNIINFGNKLIYYNKDIDKYARSIETGNYLLNNFVLDGAHYLNELFNQYFTDNILNTLSFENISTSPNLQQTNKEEKYLYRQKIPNFMESFCLYLNNEYHLPFLNAIYGKVNLFDFNLKTFFYIKKLNSYTCSPELKEKVIQHLTKNITDYVIIRKKEINDEYDQNGEFEKIKIIEDIPRMIRTYKKDISKLSNANLIYIFISESFKHFLTEYNFYQSKQHFEAFTLSLFRDKIKKGFENEKIKKDGKFFESINQHLIEMDKFLYGRWDKEAEYRDLRTGEKKIAPLAEVGSIQNLTNLYPNHLHYQEFNFLLHDLKKQIAKLSPKEQKDAISHLSFLKKQQEINDNYFVNKIVEKTENNEQEATNKQKEQTTTQAVKDKEQNK